MSYIFPNCFVCRLTSASRHCSLMCNWASPNKSIIFCFFKQTCSNLYGKPWVNKETILRIRPPSELTSRPTTDYYYSPRWRRRQRGCCLSAGRPLQRPGENFPNEQNNDQNSSHTSFLLLCYTYRIYRLLWGYYKLEKQTGLWRRQCTHCMVIDPNPSHESLLISQRQQQGGQFAHWSQKRETVHSGLKIKVFGNKLVMQ